MATYAENLRKMTNRERKMVLIADLERPLDINYSPLAEAILDQPRPVPAQHLAKNNSPKEKKVWKRGMSKAEEDRLKNQYWDHIAKPLTKKYDVDNLLSKSEVAVTTIVPGRAWVVPNLITADECDYFIREGENFNLVPPRKESGVNGMRTSKRTENFCAPHFSKLIIEKLPNELLDQLESTKPYTAFRGIHPNWRIAKYETNNFFAAHYDQADSITVKDNSSNKGKRRLDSFHTLLISLSDRSKFSGGATRLFPTSKYDDTAIDVELPRGFALVFDHKLLHAGLPPKSGVKYIAQAGILRDEPIDVVVAPLSTFKFGPGLNIFRVSKESTEKFNDKYSTCRTPAC